MYFKLFENNLTKIKTKKILNTIYSLSRVAY